jgi:hypothetical protein
MAASEWQAGPMVQMILARRAGAKARKRENEGELSVLEEELSAAGSELRCFIGLKREAVQLTTRFKI